MVYWQLGQHIFSLSNVPLASFFRLSPLTVKDLVKFRFFKFLDRFLSLCKVSVEDIAHHLSSFIPNLLLKVLHVHLICNFFLALGLFQPFLLFLSLMLLLGFLLLT